MEAEAAARADARARCIPYISPYNDVMVAGGQGTIALEVLSAIPPGQLRTVFVPVGGGGLIAGIATVFKTLVQQPPGGIRVIGCQPAASDVMRRYVHCAFRTCAVVGCCTIVMSAGRLRVGEWWRNRWKPLRRFQMALLVGSTCVGQHVIKATACSIATGGVEADSCTLQPCIDFVDAWITATETEIAEAVVDLHVNHNIAAEGAAAMTWACVRKYIAANPHQGDGVVVVCCGGNTQPTLLQTACAMLDARGAFEQPQ